MHVESTPMNTPSSDLEAMLDAAPQDEASRDARIEEFEASLADAFVRSSDEEIAEEPIDRGFIDRAFVEQPVDGDVAQTEQGTTRASPDEIYIAMSRQTSSSLIEGSSSKPVEASESSAMPTVTVLATSTAARETTHGSIDGRSDSTLSAPSQPVEFVRSAPTRDEYVAPESTRPPMNDEASPPASPMALERSQGLETAESVRGNAEPGAAAPVAPEAATIAGADLKQRDPARGRNVPPRTIAPVSTPKDPVPESTPRSEDHAQQQASRSETEIEWTPHAPRPADDPSLVRERPLPNLAVNPTPTAVQPMTETHVSVNGIQRTALDAEPAPQIAPRQPVEALPRHVEMLATRGGGTARMRLHPAQLGEVDITISIRGNAVDVIIHAEEPAARAAVMAHREQLAEALGTRELRMEGFDVNGGGREYGGENKQAAWSGSEDRRGPFTRPNELGSSDTERNGVVDRATRLASTHERQGIDLRI